MDDDARSIMLLFALAALAFVVYFAPAITATRRRHPNTTAITMLNLTLGWTLVGWVAALVWALTNFERAVPVVAEPSPPTAPAPAMRDCPYCAEPIRANAIKCKHCGSDLLTDPMDFRR